MDSVGRINGKDIAFNPKVQELTEQCSKSLKQCGIQRKIKKSNTAYEVYQKKKNQVNVFLKVMITISLDNQYKILKNAIFQLQFILMAENMQEDTQKKLDHTVEASINSKKDQLLMEFGILTIL